ncbi:hypothetical protein HGI81_05570 [Olsenella sp. KGMB02461]|nr:hypothetical protein [Olsenella sp. KGMB02461]
MGQDRQFLSPARDFFAEVRTAAEELERTNRQLDALQLHINDGGNSLTPRVVSSPSDVDGSLKIAGRMDRQAMLEARRKRFQNKISYAEHLLYGDDGCGGVAAGCSDVAADVCWMRDCMLSTWDSISKVTELSRTRCRDLREAAMDYLDSVGLDGSGRKLCGPVEHVTCRSWQERPQAPN